MPLINKNTTNSPAATRGQEPPAATTGCIVSIACHALSFADGGSCSSPTGHRQYTAVKHLHLLMQLGISLVRRQLVLPLVVLPVNISTLLVF